MPNVIVKDTLFDLVGYKRHMGQQAVHDSTARFRVAAWGRRGGKSQAGGMELLPAAYLAYYQRAELRRTQKRHEYWIVGPEYSDAEKEFRVIYNAMTARGIPFDHPGTYNNPEGGMMSISAWNGAFIVHAKSAKHPETLVGEGLRGLVLSEAAKMKRSVWEKFLRATLADYKGWLYAGSTPEGKNWFYEMWQRGQDPLQTEYWSLRAPAWINPYVYPAGRHDPEIISLQNGISAELFNQEIAALFTEYVGRVFKEFDEEVHVTRDPWVYSQEQVERHYFGAVDYGWTNPNVWLLLEVDMWGTVFIKGEVYQEHLTAGEFAEEIRAKGLCPPGVKAFYPDPASPGDSAELAKRLRIIAQPNTGGELKGRLELIRRALKPQVGGVAGIDHEVPRLYVHPDCVRTIADMNNYRYPADKGEQGSNPSEVPLKKDDHAPEALGRFFAGYFGHQLIKTNARVRKANVRG